MSAVEDLQVKLSSVRVKPHIRVSPSGVRSFVKGYVREALRSKGDWSQLETTARPSDVIDLQDQRGKGALPLKMNPDGMDLAIATAGIDIKPGMKIKVRLRDQKVEGEQGSALQTGPNEYRVVVKVARKKAWKPHYLYIINNSLVHELRHVRQMQLEKNHSKLYQQQNMTVGYAKNKYEIDSREYGRLADETGERSWKGLPEGMKILGKAIWGLLPE